MMGIVMLETCWAYKKYNKISTSSWFFNSYSWTSTVSVIKLHSFRKIQLDYCVLKNYIAETFLIQMHPFTVALNLSGVRAMFTTEILYSSFYPTRFFIMSFKILLISLVSCCNSLGAFWNGLFNGTANSVFSFAQRYPRWHSYCSLTGWYPSLAVISSPCIMYSQQFLTNWLTMREDILIHEVLRCPLPSPQRGAEWGRLQ